MEKIEEENKEMNTEMYNRWEKDHRRGKIFGGLIIVGVGCLFLAREMGAVLPSWMFTWEMILIICGLYAGVKHSFRNAGWIIMILIGSAFLLRDYYHEYDFTHYIWPVALIILGIYIILRPKRNCQARFYHRMERWHRKQERWKQRYPGRQDWQTPTVNSDDYIEVNSVFGSVKKNIVTKDFKGGEVNSVFGGSEINLTQADINGTVQLEMNSVFGGSRLIVPPHWEIKSKMEAVFGSVEDKRPLQKDVQKDGKVLILTGAAVFGGIEIRSY